MNTTASPNHQNHAIGVSIKNLSLHYHNQPEPVFYNLNFELTAGHCTCMLGRSGCGKSSLLKMMANLLDGSHQQSGEIIASDNQPLAGRISYMAQQDLLFPWLSVLDNVGLKSKLKQGKLSEAEKAKARTLLAQLELDNLEHALPHELSGGMRQRVALARTLMQDTPIVLMDEPFSALDAVTRYNMQQLAASLLKGKTLLLITHDPQEALILGDKLYLMHAQPALINPLDVPNTPTPRPINAESGEYQSRILSNLKCTTEAQDAKPD